MSTHAHVSVCPGRETHRPSVRLQRSESVTTAASVDSARAASMATSAGAAPTENQLTSIEAALGPSVLTAVAGLYTLAATHAELFYGPGLPDRTLATTSTILPTSDVHARYLSGRPRVPPLWIARYTTSRDRCTAANLLRHATCSDGWVGRA